MRMLRVISVAAVSLSILLSGPAVAAAGAVTHTVSPGESLWSIATANGLSVRSLAAYNGLSADAQLHLGSTLKLPTSAEETTGTAGEGTSATTSSGPASSAGSHVVRWGETL